MNAVRTTLQSQSTTQLVAAVRQGIDVAQRGDYAAALRVFELAYSNPAVEMPGGLSYYGLCLALAQRKYNAAIKACQSAIEQQFYESAHYVNLIRVYLAAGSRKKAVETLERAMARLPKDAEIMAMREEMGYRSAPPFPSLSRDNVVNLVGGKVRHRMRAIHITQTMKFSIAVTFLVVWFAAVLAFLMSRS